MKTIHGSLGALILLCTAFWFVGCGTENTHCSVHQNEDGATVMTCPDGSSATLPPSSRPPLVGPSEQKNCELRDEFTLQCDDIVIDLSGQNIPTPTDACTLHGGTPPYLQCGDTRIPVDTLNPPQDDLSGTCSLQGKDSAGNPILKCGDEQFAIGDGTTVTPVCAGGFVGDIVIDRIDHPILEIFEASNCIILRGNLVIENYKEETLPEVLRKIEAVYGNISIRNTDLTSAQLPNLKRVFGNLGITSNEKLLRLKDMNTLERVEGNLNISSNPKLSEISDFPNLSTVYQISLTNIAISALPTFPKVTHATSIAVGYNPQLLSFTGFQNLRTVDNGLTIEENDLLSQIAPLAKLQRGELYIRKNPVLTDIGQYPAFESGSIVIEDNELLTALPTFPKLKEADFLRFARNANLTDIGQYPAFESGSIVIEDNELLTALPTFPKLKEADSLRFARNANLTDIGQYPALESGDLFITNNELLAALPTFPKLKELESILVEYNDSLMTIGNYPSLQTILSNFYVYSNNSLGELPTFPQLQHIGRFHVGDIYIDSYEDYVTVRESQGNPSLSNIGQFPELHTIDVSFWVAANPSIIQLSGFPKLTNVTEMRIMNNAMLTEIGDYPLLEQVTGGIYVRENGSLTETPGFPSLVTLGDFNISDNHVLTQMGDLPLVERLTGSFMVFSLGDLTTVGNFPSLSFVDNDFTLVVANLENFNGFPFLRSISSGRLGTLLPQIEMIMFRNQLDDPSALKIHGLDY